VAEKRKRDCRGGGAWSAYGARAPHGGSGGELANELNNYARGVINKSGEKKNRYTLL